jgi:hypothetical protein
MSDGVLEIGVDGVELEFWLEWTDPADEEAGDWPLDMNRLLVNADADAHGTIGRRPGRFPENFGLALTVFLDPCV